MEELLFPPRVQQLFEGAVKASFLLLNRPVFVLQTLSLLLCGGLSQYGAAAPLGLAKHSSGSPSDWQMLCRLSPPLPHPRWRRFDPWRLPPKSERPIGLATSLRVFSAFLHRWLRTGRVLLIRDQARSQQIADRNRRSSSLISLANKRAGALLRCVNAGED